MSERLGHLIRRLRIKQSTEIPKADLLRILEAADLGLYWSYQAPLEIDAYSKKTQEAMAKAAGLKRERDELRELYNADDKKIKAAGFDNLNTLIEGRPRHGDAYFTVTGFARWLAKKFDGDAGLNEADWVQRARDYLECK